MTLPNLWVDDCRPAPKGWIWAKTAKEARFYLHVGVQKASLDHDLGSCEGCQSCQKGCACECHHTGCDLVKWMVKNNKWPVEKPAVHSANPPGKLRMEQLIDEHGPYGKPG